MKPQTNRAASGMTILVVEDSPTQAERLRYILEQQHFTVALAGDGEQALAYLDGQRPALVISDIVMPAMSGYELCRRLKADKRTQDLPVILLTSLSSTDDVLEGLACGADSFMTKPYSAEYLLAQIERTIAGQLHPKANRVSVEVEILSGRQSRLITADAQQMLGLLLSVYEAAAHRNSELTQSQDELRSLNEHMEDLVEERTAELSAEVAERKLAYEKLANAMVQLERTNRDLEQYAYVASHDLQEPLRMVTSHVQLLQRRYQGKLDKDADEFIAFAVEGATRMRRLIIDLLAFSQLGTNGKDLVAVSSEAALGQALANLNLLVQEDRASITHDPLPAVLGDQDQLAQLFQNLVSNAIKFHGDAAPQVDISARRVELPGQAATPMWQFSVRDNGIGIEQKYFEQIFVIFQRLHSRERYAGNGMGLPICKKIVERHGGRIWIESQPGEGTTFFFTLRAVVTNEDGKAERNRRENVQCQCQ